MDTRGYLHNAQDQLLTAHDTLPQADSISASLETPKKKGLFGRLTEKFKSAVEDTRAKVADVLTKERYLPGQKRAEEAISTVARSGMEQLTTRVEAVSSAVVEQTKQLWEASQDTVARMNTVVKGAALAGTTLATLTACGGNIAPTASYVPLQATPAPVASASPEAKEEVKAMELPEFKTFLKSSIAFNPAAVHWDSEAGELYTAEMGRAKIYVQKAGWETSKWGGESQRYTLSPEPIKTFDVAPILLAGPKNSKGSAMDLDVMTRVGNSFLIHGKPYPFPGETGGGAIMVDMKTGEGSWVDKDRNQAALSDYPATIRTSDNKEHAFYVSSPLGEKSTENLPNLRVFTEGEQEVKKLELSDNFTPLRVVSGLVENKEHVFVVGSIRDIWEPTLRVYTPEQLLTNQGQPVQSLSLPKDMKNVQITMVGGNAFIITEDEYKNIRYTLFQFDTSKPVIREYALTAENSEDQLIYPMATKLFQSDPKSPLTIQVHIKTPSGSTYTGIASLPGSEQIGIASNVPQTISVKRNISLPKGAHTSAVNNGMLSVHDANLSSASTRSVIIYALTSNEKGQPIVEEKSGSTTTTPKKETMSIKSVVPTELTFSPQGGMIITE